MIQISDRSHQEVQPHHVIHNDVWVYPCHQSGDILGCRIGRSNELQMKQGFSTKGDDGGMGNGNR
jgi:hypothetical protein